MMQNAAKLDNIVQKRRKMLQNMVKTLQNSAN